MKNWIGAWDALKLIELNSSKAGAAQAKLLQLIQTGTVPNKAKLLLQEADIGPMVVRHDIPSKKIVLAKHSAASEGGFALFDRAVPSDFFSPTDRWKIVAARSAWEVGRVLAVRPAVTDSQSDGLTPALMTRRLVTGLEFDEDRLRSLLSSPEASQPGNDQLTSRNSGRPLKEAWDEFWMAMLELLEKGDLNITIFRSQAALRAYMVEYMKGDLKEPTIKPAVRKVWYKFVEPSPFLDEN